uniref:Protein TsetseEP domain-containing protein n=1 Tax=Anopheles christyi TaxID=43041 RepID=A0A182K9X9_9DIPT
MDRAVLLILLFQISVNVATPDYGIPNAVFGTARVLSSVADASSYLDTLAVSGLVPASITQTAFNLSNIVQILQQAGTNVSRDGNNVANAISTLAQSTSADPATLFDNATQSVQNALDHIAQLLPTTNSRLSALMGNNVPGRLTDGFTRIEIRLKTLQTQLGTLKTAIMTAVADAGTETPIPTEILRKHITLKKVYDVLEAARKLRAYLPVVRYTLNSSLEDAVEADRYLNEYSGMLASLDSLVAIVLQPLNVAKKGYYSVFKGGVQGLAASYTSVKELTLSLAVNSVNESGALIATMLGKFTTTLADVDGDAATLDTQLQTYLDAIKTMVQISDPAFLSVTESKLIGALIHALIDSGPYSRYCFQKYKDLVTDLLNYLLEESSICIDREIPRLGNLAPAVQSILDVNAFDFEDIYDWLTICDELQEPINQSECVKRITQSYTTLGGYFADKYDLLYDLTSVEVNASKKRVKICIDLSRRWLSDGYIKNLQTSIEQCTLKGPTAV